MNSSVIDRPVQNRITGLPALAPSGVAEVLGKRIGNLEERVRDIANGNESGTEQCGQVFGCALASIEAGKKEFNERDDVGAYGYYQLLEAESLIAAAAALARKEADAGSASIGRALNYEGVAADAEDLTCYFDCNMKALTSFLSAPPPGPTKGGADTNRAPKEKIFEAGSWVNVAVSIMQVRSEELNSNVAAGVTRLMELAKASVDLYDAAERRGAEANREEYDDATRELGIARDSLQAFNEEADDEPLYGALLALDKARELLDAANDLNREAAQ